MEKRAGKLRRVGLELLPGGPDGGVLVGGVLQLYDAQGQAVDEQHDVRPAGIPVLRDCELVDGEEAVVGGVVEVDDADLRPANGAVLRPVLHRHAVDQHPVEGAVAGLQGGSIWVGQPAQGVIKRLGGQAGVQVGEGVSQPALQHNLAVVRSLGVWPVRSDVRAVNCPPAQAFQPPERELLNVGFGERH